MSSHRDSGSNLNPDTVEYNPDSVVVNSGEKIFRYELTERLASTPESVVNGGMEFVPKLRRLMKARGLSNKELGPMIGTYPERISKWFGGSGLPDLYQTFRLSRALDVPMEFLADDTLDEVPPSPELSQDEQLALDFYRSMREHDGATAVLKVLARMADQGIGAADERSRAASAQRRPEDEPVKVIQPTRVESTPKRRKTI